MTFVLRIDCGRKGFKLDLSLPSQVVGGRQPEFIHDLAPIRVGISLCATPRLFRLPLGQVEGLPQYAVDPDFPESAARRG
jgi:hypothetical protein